MLIYALGIVVGLILGSKTMPLFHFLMLKLYLVARSVGLAKMPDANSALASGGLCGRLLMMMIALIASIPVFGSWLLLYATFSKLADSYQIFVFTWAIPYLLGLSWNMFFLRSRKN